MHKGLQPCSIDRAPRSVFFRRVFMAALMLIGLLSFSFTKPLNAQIIKSARVELNDQQNRIFFGKNVYLTPNPQGQISERVILQRHHNNLHGPRQTSDLIHLGVKPPPTWMVFSVTNNSSSERWVLHFGDLTDGRYAMARKIFIRNSGTGEVFANIPQDIEAQDLKNQDGGHDNIIGPAAMVRVPKNTTQIFTLYLETEGHFAHSVTPFFMKEKRFIDALQFGKIPASMIAVFFIALMGFFIALTILKRVVSALFFAGYYLSLAGLFFVLNDSFLVAGSLIGASITGLFSLSMVIALMTGWSFLERREEKSTTHFILLSAAMLVLILGGACVFLSSHALWLVYLPALAALLLLSGIGLRHTRQGAHGAGYFACGWAILFIGAAVAGLSATGLIQSNALSLNAFWLALPLHGGFMVAAMRVKMHLQDEDRRQISLRENRVAQSVARLEHSKESADQARLLRVIERERELMSELREREMQRTEEMRRSKDMADEANRAKSAFLAVVSHEIRTPMTGVMGMIRLLTDTKMSKEQHEYVRAVQSSADSMMALLNDILDFEKIESGNMGLETIECDLPRLVQGIITLMSGHAAEKNITLEADISSDMPTSLIGDPTRLRQVLLNLVNNAIKFTDRGHVKIILNAKPFDNRGDDDAYDVYFAIEDTGIGISQDETDDLFNPFSQAETSTSRKYGGTGLGLAICRKLVEAMGSSIHVQTKEGHGSTFYFSIYMQAGERSARAVETPQAPVDKPALKAMNIMVVEDNDMNAKVLEGFLNKDGHNVTIAHNAEDALQILQTAPESKDLDVILCDIKLGRMSGIDLTTALRRLDNKDIARIPVIAVTGNIGAADIAHYYDANINGFIPKPIDPDILYKTLVDVSAGVFEQEVILPEPLPPLDNDGIMDEEPDEGLSMDMDDKDTISMTDDATNGGAVDDGVINGAMIDSLKKSLAPDAFDELMSGFWDKADELVDALVQVEQDKDIEEMLARAHEMKGMAGNFGFSELSKMSMEIEDACKNNDIAIASQVIKKLPDANRRAKDAVA